MQTDPNPANPVTEHSYPPVPALVEQAQSLAQRTGFGKSCTPEFGRLLRTVAAGAYGTVLEIGTGCGVGSAWIASGLPDGASLVSIDSDSSLVREVRELFAASPEHSFLSGDWREALPYGPFSLAFVDAGDAKDCGAREVIGAMKVGGVVLLDDFSPGPLFRGEPDARWQLWMQHPRLVSCEVLTERDVAAIIGIRTS